MLRTTPWWLRSANQSWAFNSSSGDQTPKDITGFSRILALCSNHPLTNKLLIYKWMSVIRHSLLPQNFDSSCVLGSR